MGLFTKKKTNTSNTNNGQTNAQTKMASNKKDRKKAQNFIKFDEFFENGMMRFNNQYAMMFSFGNFSFESLSKAEQEEFGDNYETWLNGLPVGDSVFMYIINTAEDASTKYDLIKIRKTQPGQEELVKAYNDVLQMRLNESTTLTNTRRFIIYTTISNSNTEAKDYFNSIKGDIETSFFSLLKSRLELVSAEEWLLILSDVITHDKTNPYFILNDNEELCIDADALKNQNLTIKDIISPSYYRVKPGYIESDEVYSKTYYLQKLPNFLSTVFMQDIMSMPFEFTMSINYKQIAADEAAKLIQTKITLINGEIVDKEKKSGNKGYNAVAFDTNLTREKERLEQLQSDMMDRDQKLFGFGMYITIFGDNLDELKANGNTLKSVSAKHLCAIKPLEYQQENGFNASLPLGQKAINKTRYMTTESLRVFIPFSEADLFDRDGFYYGINQISKSIIVYNRLKGQNYNGLILGSSGSGKSFFTKKEIISTLLNRPEDYVYVIDPDGEYGPLAKAFGGSVIDIAPGNGIYINPLDLDIDNSQDKGNDPIVAKSDAVASMVSIMLGAHQSLTPSQKSILNRCVTQIYQPYLEHLAQLSPDPVTGRKPTIDRAACPTLQNLFDALLQQPQTEAQNLALIMEIYATGNFDTFAHRTNQDITNKFTIYNIKDVGSNLKELALQVCINDIWNNMIANKARGAGIFTWFYIDEFHLLLSSDTCSEFLKNIWKRSRKWNGAACGITQNTEELLASPAARAILNNSAVKILLNQSAMDISILKDLVNLTDEETKYINGAEKGSGLLCLGDRVVPFKDRYPKNKIFELINTTDESMIA